MVGASHTGTRRADLCFGIVVLGLAPVYFFVASLNWFAAFISCGMSEIL